MQNSVVAHPRGTTLLAPCILARSRFIFFHLFTKQRGESCLVTTSNRERLPSKKFAFTFRLQSELRYTSPKKGCSLCPSLPAGSAALTLSIAAFNTELLNFQICYYCFVATVFIKFNRKYFNLSHCFCLAKFANQLLGMKKEGNGNNQVGSD